MTPRWRVVHAAAMTALLVAVPLLGAVPAAVFGAGSVFLFFLTARPRGGRFGVGVANLLTALRVGLVPMGVLLPRAAAVVFALVWLLDAVDGFVARRLGEVSDFGAHFDLETDALFVAALSSTLVAQSALGPWLLTAGLLRYLLVLARLAFPAELTRERRRQFGRIAYNLAVGAMLLCFLGFPAWLTTALGATSVGVLCVSFTPDFAVLRRTAP